MPSPTSNFTWADAPFRMLADVRDFSVLGFQCPRAEHRLAILWDPDRDLRAVNVALALFLREPRALQWIVALAEHSGALTVWHAADVPSPSARHAMTEACARALCVDRWSVRELHSVPLRADRTVDAEALAADHPLARIAPRYQLGTVRA